MALVHKHMDRRSKKTVEIEFMIGEEVWFVPDGEDEAILGEVVRIQADIKNSNNRTIGDVKYTIHVAGFSECFDVSYKKVYSKKYEAEGFYKFECRAYFTADAYQRETVFAKYQEDAEKMIKQKYPNVCDVEYESYE